MLLMLSSLLIRLIGGFRSGSDGVRRKSATAGSLDGWGWRETKAFLLAWYEQLARVFSKVEEIGVWLDCLLDAHIAVNPKLMGMPPLLVSDL